MSARPVSGSNRLRSVSGVFVKYDFQGRPDVSLEQVAAVGRSVCLSNHDVGVDARLLAVERDVADEGEHLYLLPNRDSPEVAALTIVVADDDVAERADAGEVSCSDLLCAREGCDSFDRLFALVEDEYERRLALYGEQLRLHRLNPLGACRES